MKVIALKIYQKIKALKSFYPIIFFSALHTDAFACVLLCGERVARVFVCDIRVFVEWDLERRICLGWFFSAV